MLTFNEEANVERTLAAVAWAPRILVIDSGSTDKTLEIVRRYPQTTVLTRTFDSFAGQCNFGLEHVASRWVLSIDADYELSRQLQEEIATLEPSYDVSAYSAEFVYRVFGHFLRGTLYPPRTVLYRRGNAIYRDEGHGHRVLIDGAVGNLRGKIYHDDRKPLARWISSQQGYARREADYLLAAPRAELKYIDRVRLMSWPAPIAVLFYTLLWKGCVLDGWPGWFYALQRMLAESMIALELIDRRLAQIRATDAGSN